MKRIKNVDLRVDKKKDNWIITPCEHYSKSVTLGNYRLSIVINKPLITVELWDAAPKKVEILVGYGISYCRPSDIDKWNPVTYTHEAIKKAYRIARVDMPKELWEMIEVSIIDDIKYRYCKVYEISVEELFHEILNELIKDDKTELTLRRSDEYRNRNTSTALAL